MAIVTGVSLARMLNEASFEKRVTIIGRALVALFNRQTESEKSCNDTHNWNSVGFSGADGKSGSLTAKYWLKHRTLMDWQVERWMTPQRNGLPKLCKYAKQLNDIAEAKASRSA
jgi:hypothetical protein